MSKVELKIIHKSGNRNLNHYHVVSDNDVITIGSSPNAKIRIIDDNVDDIHASIEQRSGKWHIIDLASKHGTWSGKSSIDESLIEKKTLINFGNETLVVEPIELAPANLYLKNKNIVLEGKKIIQSQQVVILNDTNIISSDMVKVGQKIKFRYAGKDHVFAAATSEDWTEDKIEKICIRRRNVKVPVFLNPKPSSIKGYFPEEMIKSFGMAFALAFFFFLTAWLMPKLMPQDPNALQQNKYTKMIFDPEVIKKQQKDAKESQKKLVKKEEKKKEVVKKEPERKRPVAMVVPQTEQAKKVVTQLKSSGLSDKISKIASVSLSTDALLESANSNVSKSRNRSFASKGVAVKGATLSKNAGAYNVTSVATNGVEGGSAAAGKLGGLTAGGVGGGGVVDAIEEETEISGGIDPAIIRDVVQKNMGRIRYCYERELAANPGLYGKVKLAWTITAAGAVTGQKIEQTTMKNSMVEGCMLRIVQRWTFPRPDGGGDVIVAFPFFFKANN
jgi:outer membrane biosynthesis protein TonB